MKSVTQQDIITGLEKLRLQPSKVAVHCSLSSFGSVNGGADTVIKAIFSVYETVMMPAFCWEANAAPPDADRPQQNGCNYSFYDNWSKPAVKFLIESAGIEKSMGAVSRSFIARPDVLRSDHPWHSWAALGNGVKNYLSPHSWDTTNVPLERLASDGGWVILMGVGLSSCTAVHIAEERAGRRPFIRWMRDRNGNVRRVRASGCAKGFDRLLPHCIDIFKETRIGNARILAAPLKKLISITTEIIKSDPEITRCSTECIRCADAILGGAVE